MVKNVYVVLTLPNFLSCSVLAWGATIADKRAEETSDFRFYFDRFPTAIKKSILLSSNLSFFVSSHGCGHFCGW
jgi:hypothetical protein